MLIKFKDSSRNLRIFKECSNPVREYVDLHGIHHFTQIQLTRVKFKRGLVVLFNRSSLPFLRTRQVSNGDLKLNAKTQKAAHLTVDKRGPIKSKRSFWRDYQIFISKFAFSWEIPSLPKFRQENIQWINDLNLQGIHCWQFPIHCSSPNSQRRKSCPASIVCFLSSF